jgi:hypothetical protein
MFHCLASSTNRNQRVDISYYYDGALLRFGTAIEHDAGLFSRSELYI